MNNCRHQIIGEKHWFPRLFFRSAISRPLVGSIGDEAIMHFLPRTCLALRGVQHHKARCGHLRALGLARFSLFRQAAHCLRLNAACHVGAKSRPSVTQHIAGNVGRL